MFALAIETVKRNIAFYAVVCLAVVMLESIMQAVGLVSLAFASLVMLYTHRMIQMGETHPWSDPLSTKGIDGRNVPIFRYALRFTAFFFLLMLTMTAAFMVLSAIQIIDFANPRLQTLVTLLGFLIALPAAAILLGLVGSVLPASAERGDTSLRRALARGQATLRGFVPNFLVGPGVAILIGTLLLSVLPFGTGIIGRTLSLILSTLIMEAVALLIATALSLAYLEAERA
ncbi:hypothetical protein [Shimia sp. FJ5]|uniref:hypothetical protein n=1 Tax=Shimia sp. FJ5 TaxID=3079054 RepID=UPI00260E6166|nr:hypothetical protein [Shimia sp. FJ5]MDV4145821.1 hypothetical protein [Shimia sp. FJ5]